MQLELTADEAAILKGVLESYLSDLRMEIADTDKLDFRQNLKSQEEFLKRTIQQLAGGTPTG